MSVTLRLPLQVTPGRGLLSLTQDSDADIAQSVALLLATRQGERRSVPNYGLPDPLGAAVDLAVMAQVISEWEERADPATIDVLTLGQVEQIRVHPAASLAVVTAPGVGADRTHQPPPPAPVVTPGLYLNEERVPMFDPNHVGTAALATDADGDPYVDSAINPASALPLALDSDGVPYLPSGASA